MKLNEGKRKARAMLLSIIIIIGIAFSMMTITAGAISMDDFTDIDEDYWGYGAVKYCVERGYMTGVGGGRFDPNGTVTRAQVAQVLYNFVGRQGAEYYENIYEDVKESSWYYDCARWTYGTGISIDRSCTYFKPNVPASRQEIALQFMLFAKLVDIDNERAKFVINTNCLAGYLDVKQIKSYNYEKAMAWAVQYKLMQGAAKRLNPLKNITRAEFAQVIKNYFDHWGKPIDEVTSSPSPTATPTPKPTATPTTEPTASPTATPTPKPTAKPTATPTADPTAKPTADPTKKPDSTPQPPISTPTPTAKPTPIPTPEPTQTPPPDWDIDDGDDGDVDDGGELDNDNDWIIGGGSDDNVEDNGELTQDFLLSGITAGSDIELNEAA